LKTEQCKTKEKAKRQKRRSYKESGAKSIKA
jgi:hypothetical protein